MNKKALTTLETCVLIAVATAGFLAMQGYLKRAIQGNWRSNADSFSDEYYAPGVSNETSPDSKGGQPAIVYAPNPPDKEDPLSRFYHSGSHITAFIEIEKEPKDKDFKPTDILASTNNNEILHIKDWGTYYDPKEHESDDDEE